MMGNANDPMYIVSRVTFRKYTDDILKVVPLHTFDARSDAIKYRNKKNRERGTVRQADTTYVMHRVTAGPISRKP